MNNITNLDCVPLLIKDILKHANIESTGNKKFTIFGKSYSHVQVYGRVTWMKTMDKSKMKIFDLDDGTEHITTSLSYAIPETIDSDLKMVDRQLESVKTGNFPLHENINVTMDEETKLLQDLNVIMDVIKKHICKENSNFPLGSKVSVVGIPYKKGRKVRLLATDIQCDAGQSSDELKFKGLVQQFYESVLNR